MSRKILQGYPVGVIPRGGRVVRSLSLEVKYILRDQFSDDRSAGSVNNTTATDVLNVRKVIDTENKVSISGGNLIFSGGQASPAWGDPGIWWPGTTRSANLALLFRIVHTTGYVQVGFDTDQSGEASGPAGGIFFATDSMSILQGLEAVGTFTSGTAYQFAIVLLSTGCLFYVKGGIYSSWTLIKTQNIGTDSTLYPVVSGYSGIFQHDYFRIAQLPTSFPGSDYAIVLDAYSNL